MLFKGKMHRFYMSESVYTVNLGEYEYIYEKNLLWLYMELQVKSIEVVSVWV